MFGHVFLRPPSSAWAEGSGNGTFCQQLIAYTSRVEVNDALQGWAKKLGPGWVKSASIVHARPDGAATRDLRGPRRTIVTFIRPSLYRSDVWMTDYLLSVLLHLALLEKSK